MQTYGRGTFRLLQAAMVVSILAGGAVASQRERGFVDRVATPAPASPQEPFIPALEIPDAVYVRLGNEMLAALADSLPSLMPADALGGSLPDVQSASSSQGMRVNVHFSGISYSGRVTRVLMEAQGNDLVNVTVALRNINLVF